MEHPFAITLDAGTSLINHTGSWRTLRPEYVHRLPPCNHACPAGRSRSEGRRRAGRRQHDDGRRRHLRRRRQAPSAIRAQTKTFVHNNFVDTSGPRALELAELPGNVADFRKAAANAIAARFDGVEIHAANGYLLEQFAKDGATNGITSSDTREQFGYIVRELDKLGLAYLHVVEGATGGARDDVPLDFAALRQAFGNTYVANNGYDLKLATERLAGDKADLFAFRRAFIANPDLVARLKSRRVTD